MTAPEPASPAAFYRWKDAQGLEHIVDSMDKVPEASRANAERIAFVAPVVRSDQSTGIGPLKIEWESFSAGFATAFLLGVVFVIARRTKKPVVELAVLVAAAAIIGGVYYAWSKQNAASNTAKHEVQSVQIDDSNKTNEKILKKLSR
jgi:hypothetical protein